MARLAQHADTAVLAEINITPFTDVLLVLLIIFMILASLTVPPGFEKQFSNCACGAPAKTAPKQINVTVLRSGAILVDGRHVATAGLYGVLAQLHAASRTSHSSRNEYCSRKLTAFKTTAAGYPILNA